MRNFWEGGVSVYLPNLIMSGDQIILNAVEARNTIPTLNAWGLLFLAVGIGVAGVVLIRRRGPLTRSCSTLPAMLIGCLLAESQVPRAFFRCCLPLLR